jgi:hypothetical protein
MEAKAGGVGGCGLAVTLASYRAARTMVGLGPTVSTHVSIKQPRPTGQAGPHPIVQMKGGSPLAQGQQSWGLNLGPSAVPQPLPCWGQGSQGQLGLPSQMAVACSAPPLQERSWLGWNQSQRPLRPRTFPALSRVITCPVTSAHFLHLSSGLQGCRQQLTLPAPSEVCPGGRLVIKPILQVGKLRQNPLWPGSLLFPCDSAAELVSTFFP